MLCFYRCFLSSDIRQSYEIYFVYSFCFQASCIWLLSLVKYSGSHKVVQVQSFLFYQYSRCPRFISRILTLLQHHSVLLVLFVVVQITQ